jgi:hypothetical protein
MLSITKNSSKAVISKRRTRKVSSNQIQMRGIYPLESIAAYLHDYNFGFFSGMESGFATERWALGSEMHGLVHRIIRQELDMLDKIDKFAEKPPKARYMEILHTWEHLPYIKVLKSVHRTADGCSSIHRKNHGTKLQTVAVLWSFIQNC